MEILEFQILSDKTLQQAVSPELISLCPSIDLVALSTVDHQVCIYRFNGQIVYGAGQKISSLRIDCIHWKPNGKLFATAGSDGCMRLINAESNKVVHQFCHDDRVSKITCMGWCSNITSTASKHINLSKQVDKHFQNDEEDMEYSSSLDLPRDLSLIDIEISLPKLSILPAGSNSQDIFTTRSSLDAIFHPFDPNSSNAVDVMVFGTIEGKIHIIIYDSFFVGSFDTPEFPEGALFLIRHAAQERSSTHVLLLKDYKTENLFITSMDLRFISASNGYLPLLASRSTALNNLLRYIQQVKMVMVAEWNSTQELPSRFLGNINETLNEKYNCDAVQALCHALATGHTFPPVREWLVQEISERVRQAHFLWVPGLTYTCKGYKRWHKAVKTGLENLKRVVHENMLPALERISVILSRFLGISKFQPLSKVVGFNSHQISLLLDSVACLNLISSKILMQVADEIELFASFSTWLRYEIDNLTSDTTDLANDNTEKESLIDHRKVLLYLQTVMTSSTLADHFTELPNSKEENDPIRGTDPLFELLGKELDKQRKGLPYNKSILSVEFFCETLSSQAKYIFGQIAEAEKCNVIFGELHQLGASEPNEPTDLILDINDTKNHASYLALVPKEQPDCVRVIRTNISVENGKSKIDGLESFGFQLSGGRVKDIKFSNQNLLFVLWRDSHSTELLSLPFKDMHQARLKDLNINYEPYNPPNLISGLKVIDPEDVRRLFLRHKIPTEENFVPERISIKKSEHGLLREQQRIVLLGEGGFRYKVLKFKNAASKQE